MPRKRKQPDYLTEHGENPLTLLDNILNDLRKHEVHWSTAQVRIWAGDLLKWMTARDSPIWLLRQLQAELNRSRPRPGRIKVLCASLRRWQRELEADEAQERVNKLCNEIKASGRTECAEGFAEMSGGEQPDEDDYPPDLRL